MQSSMDSEHRWAVILAGGNGVRLRPLTRFMCGDDRPKQFCKLLGGETLLSQTRRRVRRIIPVERTLLVFTKNHQPYYREELAAEASAWTIVQPFNRGTAPAILWSLLRLAELDWDGVAGFFPSDHHYERESRFRAGIDHAFDVAEQERQSVVVVGTEPDRAEADYGWIEAAEASHAGAARVRRLFEKPGKRVARELFKSGCQWNTFILVGTVRAFLEMIAAALPEYYETFLHCADRRAMAESYRNIKSTDFLRQVLAVSTERLLMTSLGQAGWSDLGDPRRARAVMERERRAGREGYQQGPTPPDWCAVRAADSRRWRDSALRDLIAGSAVH